MPQQFCSRRLDVGALPTEINDPMAALQVIEHVRHDSPGDQVVALLLDGRQGRAVVVVDGCHEADHPDAVITVIDRLAAAAACADQHLSIVVATSRHASDGDPLAASIERDRERWRDACEVAEHHGCDLVEWFVIAGDVVWCPRALTGEPPRW